MSNEVAKKGNFSLDYAKKMTEFRELNEGFDLGEIELGTFLRINKKGQLESKENEDLKFNEIECVMLSSKNKYRLWGKEGSPQEGTLIIDAESKVDAVNAFEALVNNDVEGIFGELYDVEDIGQRMVVTITTEDENVWALDLSYSSIMEFKKYVKYLFVAHKVSPKQVVTRISTQEKKSGSNSWLAFKFDLVNKL